MRIELTSAFTTLAVSEGTLQNVSRLAQIELSSAQTENTGIVLNPGDILQFKSDVTLYARAVWKNAEPTEKVFLAHEPFKGKGEGGDNVLTYKGSVETYADLPSTHNVGDVYNIQTADETHGILAGDNVAWNGTSWDRLAGIYSIMQGATSSAAGKAGLAPAPAAGDETKVFFGDGTYKNINGVPLASIIPWVHEGTTIPEGFLLCDGSAVSRTEYPDLYGAIGSTYGAGDGSTTFNLPDLTGGEFLEGDTTAGTTKAAGLPNITGTILTNPFSNNTASSVRSASGALAKANTGEVYTTTSAGSETRDYGISFDASRSSSIYGNSDTVQPKSLTVRYLIKYTPAVIDSEVSAASSASQARAAAQEASVYAGSAGIPLGTILPYSANGDCPSSFLFCEGQAVSRTMYPDLFALIGTTYGAGDGSTTFNLPNLVGKYPQGSQTAGTTKAAGLPNITGTGTRWVGNSSAHGIVSQEATGALKTVKVNTTYLIGSTPYDGEKYYTDDFDASSSNPIYGNSDTVTPPTLTFRWIIKAYDAPTPSSAQIDLSQYASDLAKRLTREQTPAFNKRDVITTSGTYTAPVTGWYRIAVKGGGAGGSGGAHDTSIAFGGRGGGEGGTTISYEKMTAGQTASVVIGAGGAGGAGNNSSYTPIAGTDGGNSSVSVNGNTYVGNGGKSYGVGGAGTIPGAPGNSPNAPSSVSSMNSPGGNGGGNGGGAAGLSGTFGGGGCGGSSQISSGSNNGTAGGNGYAEFSYFDPTLM